MPDLFSWSAWPSPLSLTAVTVANWCWIDRLIIDAIDKDHPSKACRSRAYIYAFLAFLCTLLKACLPPSFQVISGWLIYVTVINRLKRMFSICGLAAVQLRACGRNWWLLFMTKRWKGKILAESSTRIKLKMRRNERGAHWVRLLLMSFVYNSTVYA